MRTLRELTPGERSKVVSLEGAGPIRRRLMDMGVTRGSEILVRRVAPLGDPIEVTIRGYELSFRKEEAQHIMVE